MKKIRVWKVVFLNLITLHIYGIIWLARRRNEMVKHQKMTLPHWLWLVVPFATVAISIVAVGTIAIFMMTEEQVVLILIPAIIVPAVIAFAISIWWILQFGRAANRATKGRVPAMWTVLYWIFLGNIAIFMLQYWINRTPKGNVRQHPSRRFIVWSVTAFLVVSVISVVDFIYVISIDNWPSADIEKAREIDNLGKKASELNTRYLECIERLNLKYPELTAMQEADYNKGYAACEQIRLEQNRTVEQQEKAIEQW